MKILLHYAIAFSVVAVCMSTAWKNGWVYLKKVKQECPKHVDLSGNVKGCEEELGACFKTQDKIYDHVGAGEAVTIRQLIRCGTDLEKRSNTARNAILEVIRLNRLIIQCEAAQSIE